MIKSLLQSSFLRFSSIVFVGNFLAQLIILASFAYFARFFPKVEIGVYAVFVSLSALFAILATGRYELAIMLPKEKKDAISLLLISLFIAFSFSLILYLVLLIFPLQNYFLKLEKLGKIILLWPFGIFLMATFQSFIQYFNRLKSFKINALLKVIQAISMLVISYLLSKVIGLIALTLVLAWLLSQGLIFTIYLLIFAWKLSLPRLEEIKSLLKEYKRYPSISLFANFINVFSIELPNYFIPAFWGAQALTDYSYGARIAAMPRNFIGASIGDVFYNSSSEIALHDPKALLAHLKKVTRNLFILSIVIYSIGIVLGKYFIPLIFGPDYEAAIPYFNWMALASIFMFVQSPISVISDVICKLKAPFVFTLVSFVIKVLVLFLAGSYLANPIDMFAAYAVVSAALSLFWIQYLTLLTKQFNQKTYNEHSENI